AELHDPLAAEPCDDLHRRAVAAHHDRPVRDDAAERGVAGAHLLGHVDAAATDREAHLEAGGGEVALALGEPDRPEGRQNRRRREQIGDLALSIDFAGRFTICGMYAAYNCGT